VGHVLAHRSPAPQLEGSSPRGDESVYVGYIDAIDETVDATATACADPATDGFQAARPHRDEAATVAGTDELPGARIGRILDAASWPAGATYRALDTGTPKLDPTTLTRTP